MDGWYLGSFVHGAFKKLATEQAVVGDSLEGQLTR
jgi:hypothetical protein